MDKATCDAAEAEETVPRVVVAPCRGPTAPLVEKAASSTMALGGAVEDVSVSETDSLASICDAEGSEEVTRTRDPPNSEATGDADVAEATCDAAGAEKHVSMSDVDMAAPEGVADGSEDEAKAGELPGFEAAMRAFALMTS